MDQEFAYLERRCRSEHSGRGSLNQRAACKQPFGDIARPGRNWAHVNSVSCNDPRDDSIFIISSRHQSAIIKIGRDKSEMGYFPDPSAERRTGVVRAGNP